MVINLVGFWLVGLPISAWLGLRTGLGPRGLWWGLVVGLAAVALILLARVRSRLAGQVARVAIDAPVAGVRVPR
jgi:MATE family multidrug resistance protein